METFLIDVESREAIKKIIQGRDISVRSLAGMIDIAEQSVSSMLSGGRTLTDKTLAKMAKALAVPFEVVKYGDGVDLYLNNQENSSLEDHTNARVLGINDPDVYQQVKFISYAVWATFTDNFADFDFDDIKATFPVYLPPLNTPINEKHMVFEIMGDSMEERLFNRDIILTELMDEGNIEYLNSGIYVVAYRNQLVVKRIIDNDLLINGTLTLHSDNKRHGKIVVRRDDIRYIWKFIAVVFSRAQ